MHSIDISRVASWVADDGKYCHLKANLKRIIALHIFDTRDTHTCVELFHTCCLQTLYYDTTTLDIE